MALSVPEQGIQDSCETLLLLSAWFCAFLFSLEVPFPRSKSARPVVKLGSPSSTGKSNAKVAFPFSDASPALQDLSSTVGSSPAAGLA